MLKTGNGNPGGVKTAKRAEKSTGLAGPERAAPNDSDRCRDLHHSGETDHASSK